MPLPSICVAVGSLAAYGLTRFPLRGKRLIMAFILMVSLFPPVALVSPLLLGFQQLGLLNTYAALIIPYLTFALPLTVWLLTAFFRPIPKELEEAALLDGAGRLRVLWEVTLPWPRPASLPPPS